MSKPLKWTPGPWTVTDCDNAGGTGRKSQSLICSPSRPSVDNPGMWEFDVLAEVIGPPPVSADERKANAHLIAAAPELYEIADWLDVGTPLRECLQAKFPNRAENFLRAVDSALAKVRRNS